MAVQNPTDVLAMRVLNVSNKPNFFGADPISYRGKLKPTVDDFMGLMLKAMNLGNGKRNQLSNHIVLIFLKQLIILTWLN